MAGATRSICEGREDTRFGSGRGAPPFGAAPSSAGTARSRTAARRTEWGMASSPGIVLLLVVCAEAARLDRLPPSLVVFVPRDGRLEGGGESMPGLPAERA